MKLSIDRGIWLTGLLFLGILIVSVYLIFSLLRSHFDEEVERRALSAQQVVLAQIHQAGWAHTEDGELWAFELPYVLGVEVFSADGRRIWGAGEPLEIVGYKLNRDTLLIHKTPDNAVWEYYWPANLLTGDQGVAVRVDVRAQRVAMRRLGNRLLLLYGAASVGMAVLAIGLFRRRRQREQDA